MDAAGGRRKERFQYLLTLICIYHNWTWRRLARALDYDPGNLHKVGENPKLVIVQGVAALLDWPVECVIDFWGGSAAGTVVDDADELAEGDFESVLAAAKSAYTAGEYARTVALAKRAGQLARNSESYAWACNVEGAGWNAQGYYAKSLEARRRALRREGVSPALRRMLEVNAANAYYTLEELTEARGLASSVIESYRRIPPVERIDRGNEAFAYYVLGHTSRRLARLDPDSEKVHARAAKVDLEESCRLWSQVPGDPDQEYWGGIANTCWGGIVEADAALGLRAPDAAIAELWEGLPTELDGDGSPVGDWLESYGWWCVFGCNVALRHLSEVRMQRPMAKFTNKGYQIAERLGNWALRERLLTLDLLGKVKLAELTETELVWPLDQEEKQLVIGAMGRFPRFFETGVRILNTAA